MEFVKIERSESHADDNLAACAMVDTYEISLELSNLPFVAVVDLATTVL